MTQKVEINGFFFDDRALDPIIFEGRFSGKELNGLDISCKVHKSDVEQLEDLANLSSVAVNDPFREVEYEAQFRIRSYSYQNSDTIRSYQIEVREIDMPPEYDQIEIEGTTFDVLKIAERESKDGISRDVLLQLNSEEELQSFREIFEKSPIKFKRVGIDENHIEAYFGRMCYWSTHHQDDKIFYKQWISLIPPSSSDEKNPFRVVVSELDYLQGVLVSRSVRFESLLNKLTEKGILTEKDQEDLLENYWREMLPEERIREIEWKIKRVIDAKEFFDYLT